jgi:formate dehydrogenase major subunit
MVVRTESETVIHARRTIVDLLLMSGDHDCDSCDVDGMCELQEAASRLGIEKPSEPPFRAPIPMDESHPLILRNPEHCIHCHRCIRGCNRTVVNEVLDVAFRGRHSVIVADMELPLGKSSCVGCGECVQLCPTDALVERKAKRNGERWTLEKVRTTCPYCGVGCQIHLHVDRKTDRVIKVTGVEGAPPNDGMLCVKGRFAYDFPSSPRRLTRPLIKKNGRHEPVSWEEALDFTASRLRQIRDARGPDSISAVSSSRDTNENSYATQKFMRAVIGTNNVDNCART